MGKGRDLASICSGVRGQVELSPVVEEFIEDTLAAIDNPQLSYIMTPHWGVRVLSRVKVNDARVEATSLSPLFSGEGAISKPLILNMNGSVIGRRLDYRRAISGGFDSLIYVGDADYVADSPILLGDLTVRTRGQPTGIPVIYVRRGLEGLISRYSISYSLINELYYDLVIVREGDEPYLVVIGFNVSPIFLGVNSCELINALINVVKFMTSPDLRLNYVVHVAINDEWGNPRLPPLHWGFSTVTFIENTLREIQEDLTPLTYIYVDSIGEYNTIEAPMEVREAMGRGELGELGFVESPGILPDNYGYWPIVVRGGAGGLGPGEVIDSIKSILMSLESNPGRFISNVTASFVKNIGQSLSINEAGDLVNRINPSNSSAIKSLLVKYVYDRINDTIARVNLLNASNASMIDVATGYTYIDAPDGAVEPEVKNLRLTILSRIRELLVD